MKCTCGNCRICRHRETVRSLRARDKEEFKFEIPVCQNTHEEFVRSAFAYEVSSAINIVDSNRHRSKIGATL